MTDAWVPRFACPECRATGHPELQGFACPGCGRRFERQGGIMRCLLQSRCVAAEAFHRQYRSVRGREGYRRSNPDYYRNLPCVAADDPHAHEWDVRRRSYFTLQRHTLRTRGQRNARILDLGAGNGWLTHCLATEGHAVVAVDRLDDEMDGLGACRHYPVAFAVIQADFDALPFEPAQFDLAVFNASLHYSPSPETTLTEAARMLVPGGVLAVMDSPMFQHESDGRAMLADHLERLARDHDLGEVVRPGVGFLTFDLLAGVSARLGRHARFVPSRGPIGWWLRRQLAGRKAGRAPAAFGVWVSQ